MNRAGQTWILNGITFLVLSSSNEPWQREKSLSHMSLVLHDDQSELAIGELTFYEHYPDIWENKRNMERIA